MKYVILSTVFAMFTLGCFATVKPGDDLKAASIPRNGKTSKGLTNIVAKILT